MALWPSSCHNQSISFIAKKTIGQRTNPLWCIVRKHRITASNFGAVLGCIRRNRYPPSLMKRLLSAYNLEAVKSVAWGIWLHESGVLGASPDGLVKTTFMMPVIYQSSEARHLTPDIIEVKCPYAARTVGIETGVDTVKGFCLVRGEDACLHLSESHEYYHQIQGQLYILGKDCCDLLVWTPIDMVVIRIAKDPSWAPNMIILIDFFHNQFLKSILS
ncbi:uncharacterized protein LOC124268353 [Haliotis rubra]|uniref:uncharacterized protein LOC124268353 n=1 Tax=Haliotis rubra TaxID=36100 RepID=UPI001EE5D208|nr:uncharacterized protein LOC124268353 [Haliotis rubra]